MEEQKRHCMILFQEIFAELDAISSQLSTQKGVGMEYCRDKLERIQQQYQEMYRKVFGR